MVNEGRKQLKNMWQIEMQVISMEDGHLVVVSIHRSQHEATGRSPIRQTIELRTELQQTIKRKHWRVGLDSKLTDLFWLNIWCKKEINMKLLVQFYNPSYSSPPVLLLHVFSFLWLIVFTNNELCSHPSSFIFSSTMKNGFVCSLLWFFPKVCMMSEEAETFIRKISKELCWISERHTRVY